VVIATGSVSTLAGAEGQSGSVDGVGSAARFSGASALVADGAGNLFVSEPSYAVYRKIVIATGTVTTVPGYGVFPGALVPDGAGNLYALYGGAVQKIDIATGIRSMLAVTEQDGSQAQFSQAQLVSDLGGNLWVTDGMRHILRKIVLATGIVTTVAGADLMSGTADGVGAAARFTGPGGVLYDGAGNLYVIEADGSTIRKVVLATADVTTITTTKLPAATAMAVDGVGNLYFGGNFMIRKVEIATGTETVIAGSPASYGTADGTGTAARFGGPTGITSDGSGNLFVMDTGNGLIRQVIVATGAVTTIAGGPATGGSADGVGSNARFTYARGITSDGAGNLFVADMNAIREVVVATRAVTTFAGQATTPGYVDGTLSAARFGQPLALVADGAGTIYVADNGNQVIRSIAIASGMVTTLAGTAGVRGGADGTGAAASFGNPSGITIDGKGNLYVADSTNQTIRKIVIATGVVTTLAGVTNAAGGADSADSTRHKTLFNDPTALASDGADTLYVADQNNHTIRQIVLSTGIVSTPIGVAGRVGVITGPLPAQLDTPAGLAVGLAGELMISDENVLLVAR
jgi:sugar lactone lactonase YvrE